MWKLYKYKKYPCLREEWIIKKMLLILILTVLLMWAKRELYSQNNMPLIRSLAGEYIGSYFGESYCF